MRSACDAQRTKPALRVFSWPAEHIVKELPAASAFWNPADPLSCKSLLGFFPKVARFRGFRLPQAHLTLYCQQDDALAIVKTIITLAHQLGRQVIAEGIETAEHLVILRSLGCEYGQGYFFAKPLAPEEVDTLLASGRRW